MITENLINNPNYNEQINSNLSKTLTNFKLIKSYSNSSPLKNTKNMTNRPVLANTIATNMFQTNAENDNNYFESKTNHNRSTNSIQRIQSAKSVNSISN